MRNLVPISFSSSQTLGRENAFANRLWTRSGRESKRERERERAHALYFHMGTPTWTQARLSLLRVLEKNLSPPT